MSVCKDLLSRLYHLSVRSRHCAAAGASSCPPEKQRSHGGAETEAESSSSSSPFAEDRPLPANHPHTLRLRRLATGLVAAACDEDLSSLVSSRRRRLLRGLDWRVRVIDDPQENAFCRADGAITVCTGFLLAFPDDADVLAVLGHEVGHVVARHGPVKRRARFWVRVLVNFAACLLLNDDVPVPAGDIGGDWETLFMRPHLLSREFEADRIGLRLVAAAGYHPRVAPGLFWKWHEHDRRRGTSAKRDHYHGLAATHPPDMQRAKRLSRTEVMGEAMELYRQAVRAGRGGDATLGSANDAMFALSVRLFWMDQWFRRARAASKTYVSSAVRDFVRNARAAVLGENLKPIRRRRNNVVGSSSLLLRAHHRQQETKKNNDGEERCCPFCNQLLVPEPVAHIALNCSFAKKVWKNTLSWAGIPAVLPPAVPSLGVWWKYLRSAVEKRRRDGIDVLVLLVVGHLWLERNARRFGKERMTSTQLTIKIKQRALFGLETPAPSSPCSLSLKESAKHAIQLNSSSYFPESSST